MRVVGIICEYNPFHAGHAWQLAEVRRRLGEDTAVVCVMSGNFVQRGDFALVRKHARAEAAVLGGADLVLELPLPWSVASAGSFARGGTAVLESTGVVDLLAFGSECADTARIVRAARALDAQEFPPLLHEALQTGASFAAARASAARRLIGGDAAVLDTPNDALGVEYCACLLRSPQQRIEPLALPRAGAAHDGEGSASHIRALLAAGASADEYLTADMRRIYEAERAAGRAPVRMETLERAILAKLRTLREEEFAACDEGGEGLYHRLYAASRAAAGVGELLDSAKTKRYAHARLRRMLLQLFLGYTAQDIKGDVPYLRVLAMNDKGKALLHQMRKAACLPVLTKPADAKKLPAEARRAFEREACANDLYALAYPSLASSAAGSEWRTSPVIVETGKETE